MEPPRRTDRYSRVAVLLHWTTAALIAFNLGLGFFMEGFTPPLKHVIIPLHLSAGFTVLVLSLVRIGWRLRHKPPVFLGILDWQKHLALLVHLAVYCLMILLPLTGMAIISCHPKGGGPGAPTVWGLFEMPLFGPLQTIAPPAMQKIVHDQFVTAHSVLGWLMLSLLVAHILAALKHQFLDRQPQMARMALW